MNIRFSVLLSVYYKESPDFLSDCLKSIIELQSIKPNEIVLVEDGKLTDDLYQVINYWEEQAGSLIKRIPLDSNGGLGKALNIGLSHCNNEWVFRMDTDDICFPDRFEKQLTYIKNKPSVSIFSGQIIEFSDDLSKVTGYRNVPLAHNAIVKLSKTRNPFNHMAVAYKKSVIESVGGYQHHTYMEDYNLWLRVLASGHKSANLNDTLVKVRAGTDMITRRSGKQYIGSEWQLFKLKKDLHCQSTIPAFSTFIARSVPRLLPNKILTKIYSTLRAD